MQLRQAGRVVAMAAMGVMLMLLASCRSRVDNEVAAGNADGGAATTGHTLSADTLRGIIVESGPAPNTTLLLQPPAGERFVLRGSALALLRRVVGLEVQVEGRRTGERDATSSPRGAGVFDVDRFVVRAADGIAAHDGVVRIEREMYWLALQDGRKLASPNLPVALRTKPGARVFLAGPLDRPPASYGIIAEAR
jgi:hypothetical protein